MLMRPMGLFYGRHGMLKPDEPDTEYLYDFEPPREWEQLRDEDGEVMAGCFRTIPAPDSDSL